VACERRFDPPLTARGAAQAFECAGLLETTGETFGRIFTSPLARCLGTANEIARALDLPVSVLPGLASCAAAVARAGLGNLDLLSRADMQALCPSIDDFDADAPADFFGACAYACLRSRGSSALVVSHREGIRDLANVDYAGRKEKKNRLHLPYCATARFVATLGRDDDGRDDHSGRDHCGRDHCFLACTLDALAAPTTTATTKDRKKNSDDHHRPADDQAQAQAQAPRTPPSRTTVVGRRAPAEEQL